MLSTMMTIAQSQWFSNFVDSEPPSSLLNPDFNPNSPAPQSFCFSKFEMEFQNLLPNRFPGDTETADPGTAI